MKCFWAPIQTVTLTTSNDVLLNINWGILRPLSVSLNICSFELNTVDLEVVWSIPPTGERKDWHVGSVEAKKRS